MTDRLATYHSLCVDAVDVSVIAEFWAGVLGGEVTQRNDGVAFISGRTPRHTIWVNPVPEPVTVKQRVHLDVHTDDVEDVLELGATPLDVRSFRWKVLRDPEGGELCAFEREHVPEDRLYEIVVDCADPEALATWWAGLIGGRCEYDAEHGWAGIEEIPDAPFAYLVFVPVPEPKTVKNRIHLDVTTGDLEAIVAAGATVLRPQDDEIGWTILADPEGNEFCAFVV